MKAFFILLLVVLTGNTDNGINFVTFTIGDKPIIEASAFLRGDSPKKISLQNEMRRTFKEHK